MMVKLHHKETDIMFERTDTVLQVMSEFVLKKYTKFSDLDYTDMQSDISIRPIPVLTLFDSKMTLQ